MKSTWTAKCCRNRSYHYDRNESRLRTRQLLATAYSLQAPFGQHLLHRVALQVGRGVQKGAKPMGARFHVLGPSMRSDGGGPCLLPRCSSAPSPWTWRTLCLSSRPTPVKEAFPGPCSRPGPFGGNGDPTVNREASPPPSIPSLPPAPEDVVIKTQHSAKKLSLRPQTFLRL